MLAINNYFHQPFSWLYITGERCSTFQVSTGISTDLLFPLLHLNIRIVQEELSVQALISSYFLCCFRVWLWWLWGWLLCCLHENDILVRVCWVDSLVQHSFLHCYGSNIEALIGPQSASRESPRTGNCTAWLYHRISACLHVNREENILQWQERAHWRCGGEVCFSEGTPLRAMG